MDKLKYASGLLGADDGEQVEELELSTLQPFAQHPFQVQEDENFHRLLDSIAHQGVAVPILVRPKGRGTFEIISGHRRVKASETLGKSTIPAFIRDLNQEEAVLFMVDTNIQRESLLFSEKAFAYRMKLEALKAQAKKKMETSGAKNPDPMGQNLSNRERLSQNSEDSSVQIQRYIRLTYLTKELLQWVDQKKLPFQTGVELSHLTEAEQTEVFHIMEQHKVKPTLSQSTQMKKLSQSGALTLEIMESILKTIPDTPVKLSFKGEIRSFFPENTSAQEMEQLILELLCQWKERQ